MKMDYIKMAIQVEPVIHRVRDWLHEEKDQRILSTRIAKLEYLMKFGFLPLKEAEDIFALTRPVDSRDPV